VLIVLDTNLLVADPALGTGPSAILLDYAHRTESRILLSSLVLDELVAHRIRLLEAQWHAYVRAAGNVRSFAPDTPAVPPRPDFESIAQGHVKDVRERLHVFDHDVLPMTEGQLREAVKRAVQRTPPCTERGEEIRDTIIWLQVLQLVREKPGTAVAFISGNIRQFATKDGTLLPALAAEAAAGRLVYYTSLDAFGKQHATPIQFITTKWIEERITPDDVYAAAEERLSRLADPAAWRRSAFTDVSIEGHSLDLSDFYVYEMEDGTLRVVAYWGGSIEYRTVGGYDYGFNPATGRHEYHDMAGFELAEVEFSVTTEAIVRDQTIQSWEVVGIDRQ
jgi:hypothetical protein